MPYPNIEEAKKAGFPTHIKGKALTIEQVNKLAGIYDALKKDNGDNAMPMAIAQIEKTFIAKQTFSTVKDIFSVGTWNGDYYGDKDLDDMVKNFELLKKENPTYKDGVPLKVDFFKDTKKDGHGGMPAAGLITRIYREGKKLFAEINNIPKVIKELIESKAYRQVSAEVIWNYKHNEERLSRVLKAVALLGVEFPGVSNLNEFAALYVKEFGESEEFKSYITETNKTNKEEQEMAEVKELEEQLKKEKQEKEDLIKKYEALEKEKKASQEKADAESKKAAELAISQKKAEIKTFVEKQKADGKVLPAHEKTVMFVMENIDVSKTVKFTDNAGKESDISALDAMKIYIESLPKIVDFKEKSETSKEGEQKVNDEEILKTFKENEKGGEINAQKLDFLTKEYMKADSKTFDSYEKAYQEAFKKHPELR